MLRPGGAVGISYNTHVLSRSALTALCERAGLSVVTGPGYDDLTHRVDQSIERDVVVARK